MRYWIRALTSCFEVSKRIMFLSQEILRLLKHVSKTWPGWLCMTQLQLWDVQQGHHAIRPHCLVWSALLFKVSLCCIFDICEGRSCSVPLEWWLRSSKWGAEPYHCPVSLPGAPWPQTRRTVFAVWTSKQIWKLCRIFCHKEQQMVPNLAAHRLQVSLGCSGVSTQKICISFAIVITPLNTECPWSKGVFPGWSTTS